MNRQLLLSAAMALSGASSVLGQATTSSTDPLGQFLGTLNSAVGVISSANAQATAPSGSSSSSPANTSASPTPAPSTPPTHHGLSNGTKLIIAIVCAVVGAFLLAAILGLCCCLLARRRRHRKEKAVKVNDNEKASAYVAPAKPLNPGRTYTPVNQNGHIASIDAQQRVPMMTPVAQPNSNQHPAHRHLNPFVPVPPSPRKGAYSSGGLTDSTAHDHYTTGPRDSYNTATNEKLYGLTGPHDSYSTGPHDSYATAPLIAPTQPLRTSTQQPRSRSNSRPSSAALPKSANAERPSTPFGLASIGQPYDDMHVHVLQTEHPSKELQQSLRNREPIQRYHTPPLVPSRSPHRQSIAYADSSYQSSSSSNTNSGSGEEWRRSQIGAGGQTANIPPWEQRQNRFSDGTAGAGLDAPPVPWDDQPNRQRGQSGSYSRSSSGDGNGNGNGHILPHDRRGSSSPATSINGQPRRLRFSDLQANDYRNGISPHTSADYQAHQRHSQGVGEAL